MNSPIFHDFARALLDGRSDQPSLWQLAWKLGIILYLVILASVLTVRKVGDSSANSQPAQSSTSFSFRQSTPFTPLKPTPTYNPPRPVTGSLASGGSGDNLLSGLPIQLFLPAILTHSPSVGEPAQSFTFQGIDFQEGSSRILIDITPPTRQVNSGKPIRISFLPGDQCQFGDKHACVFSYRTGNLPNVIFLTIHSGVGGEGQKLRHAIEGTGINQAGLKLNRVLSNLEALEGAAVSVHQDGQSISGLQVFGLSRIPPKKIHEYFDLPVEQALEYAVHFDETLLPPELTGQPLIVLETCGWKMPGEPWAKDVTATTGSIYLGVIAPIPSQ